MPTEQVKGYYEPAILTEAQEHRFAEHAALILALERKKIGGKRQKLLEVAELYTGFLSEHAPQVAALKERAKI